ncbi:IclR family transcriptional regulator [Variovorax ureilyticus]|uniref:IclR family transcriptional regulator n=1 Tax=Variovorax ureilyticus TaxID=1836198 RepID=A0ABU8VM37_9BURK
MSGVMERTLGILELLSQHGEGLELAAVADRLNMPRSAAHRLLNDLIRVGYVRQLRDHGDYMLTTKLVSVGLSFLSQSGIVDFSQPLLDRLAEISGELVRLSVVDGERLTWVARAQGARQGLRYDPDMGSDARLSCSSSGLAWMAGLSDDEAMTLASRQGIGQPDEYGPNAPRTMQDMMVMVHAARERGYSVTVETFTAGLNAMAAPVRLGNRPPIGVITIAGPTVRFTEERMHALAPELLSICDQMAAASGASPFFQGAHSGSGGRKSGRLPIYAA